MPTDSYKPKVLVSTLDLPEADWLEYRRRGIGGSDAAAIFGVSPFKTARDLYYDKLKIASFEDEFQGTTYSRQRRRQRGD